MARRYIALVAVLALAGCDLGGGTPERQVAPSSGTTSTAPAPTLTVPRPTPTELVVQAIRSCEVKRIVFGHGENTWVTFRGGETVRHRKLDTERLERAAWNHSRACDMVVGIE